MRASKPGPTVSLYDAWVALQEERLGYLAPKTQANYTQAARVIPQSRKAIAAYSSQDIYKLIKHLPPGAYMTARSFLSTLFTFAIRRGYTASNPVRDVETRKLGKIARWPSESVYSYISRIPDPEVRLVLETMYASGQRLSDVLAISSRNLSKDGILKLTQKKTGNEIEVPIGASITNRLFALQPESGKPFFSVGAAKVWRAWRMVRPDSSLSPHGLRKAASCEAAEGGASEAELQAFLGHKTPRAAALYRLEANRAVLAASAVGKRNLLLQEASD